MESTASDVVEVMAASDTFNGIELEATGRMEVTALSISGACDAFLTSACDGQYFMTIFNFKVAVPL